MLIFSAITFDRPLILTRPKRVLFLDSKNNAPLCLHIFEKRKRIFFLFSVVKKSDPFLIIPALSQAILESVLPKISV